MLFAQHLMADADSALEVGWRAAEGARREMEDDARWVRAEKRRLKRDALAGDEKATRFLTVLLPSNSRAYRTAAVRP